MALCTHTRTRCWWIWSTFIRNHMKNLLDSYALWNQGEIGRKLLQGTQVWGHVQLLCRQQTSCTDLLVAAPLCSSSAHFLKCPLPTHTVTWQISEVCIPCSSHKSSRSDVILGQILYILWLSNSARADTALADTALSWSVGEDSLDSLTKMVPKLYTARWKSNCSWNAALNCDLLSAKPIHPHKELSCLLKDLILDNSL